ncbi:outer membrane protein transport protein [Pseudomonas oryzihabitans]|uniref:outer membrane protein transport protein n=1 Tax=Pseudomonas oryzihabitans TaxID=47885 RepID=UPI001642476D|nr:outer membrane protein transport protein [Pseudomonas oryzihabitans]
MLFLDSPLVVRVGAVGVDINQDVVKANGEKIQRSSMAQSMFVPFVALKANLGERVACAFNYAQPYGLSFRYSHDYQDAQRATNPFPVPNATKSLDVKSQETALTCAVNFVLGPGKFYVLGGGFQETISYQEHSDLGTLRLQDNSGYGYRAGLAYAIPEYAFIAQILYRSAVHHELNGHYSPDGPFASILQSVGLGGQLAASASGDLPQSLTVSLQTGIAPDWLAFGSLRWVDWSVLPSFDSNIPKLAPLTGGEVSKQLNFRDGYTATLGIGHRFSDLISGSTSVIWDRRTGSQSFAAPGSLTLATAVEFTTGVGKFGAGLSVAYIQSATTRQADGALVDTKFAPGWAPALGLTYTYLY